MPGWGWRHQRHRGHKLKVNFWSHPQLLNPSVWLWGQSLYICISTHSLYPSTLCCHPLHHASLCLLLPPSCPTKFLREGFLLPSTLPEGSRLSPYQVLLVAKSRDFSSDPIPLDLSEAVPQGAACPLFSRARAGLVGQTGHCCSARPAQPAGTWAQPHSCHMG